jgi:phage head maturation protease
LQLAKDRSGLKADIRPPDTTNARDLMTQVGAGLVSGMSFRFRPYDPMGDGSGRTWTEEEVPIEHNGKRVKVLAPVRTITDMIFSEVSVVMNPAYLDSTVNLRNKVADAAALEEYRTLRPGGCRTLEFYEQRARAGMR